MLPCPHPVIDRILPGRTAKRDLLGLREEVIGVAIEHHLPDHLDRHQFLRNHLGCIQHIEGQLIGCFLVDNLKTKFELGEVTARDRFVEIPAVKIGIGAADLNGLVPKH